MKVAVTKSDKDQNMALLVARSERFLVFTFLNCGRN